MVFWNGRSGVAVKVMPHRGDIAEQFIAVSAFAPVLWLVPPVLSFEMLREKRTICGFAILWVLICYSSVCFDVYLRLQIQYKYIQMDV